jgi:aspartate/methionine/tyrosine aminotransferase
MGRGGATPASDISYAQWVRQTTGRIGASRGRLVTLFDSSVPEPVELLRETVAAAFARPITSRYTSAFVGGNTYVIDALARRYALPAGRILCTTGATGALSLAYRALAGPGDHVLIESPGFDLFHHLAHAYGLTVDTFPRRGEQFSIDPAEVAARIGPRTKLVVLTDLHNPSGMQLAAETLDALARLAEERNIFVIVDEVYGDYADKAARPFHAAQRSDRLISISSLTKVYGLSTLRCGWIVAAPEPMARLRTLSEQAEFGISNLAHAVAALVLEDEPRFMAYSLGILARSRPIVEACHRRWLDDELGEGCLPDFGCIWFPRLVGIDDTESFAAWLAERSGVIVAPGEYFGRKGHVRIGYAQIPSQLEYGLDALTDGLRAFRDIARRSRTA